MQDADRRLDGNAAAGLLQEIFPFEVTLAEMRCDGCGAEGPLGALMVYGEAMGAIVRCPKCDGALLRVTHVRGQYVLDLRGATWMRFSAE
jgi:hypothetical protein